jgi:hypothetical protein
VSVPATTVALPQSSTWIPSVSCATAHTSVDQTPGSEIVVVRSNVVVPPTGRPSPSAHAA